MQLEYMKAFLVFKVAGTFRPELVWNLKSWFSLEPKKAGSSSNRDIMGEHVI